MIVNESQKFLDREIDSNLQTVLAQLSNQIHKLSDFGADVLKWDLERQRGGDALIPPMLFLRNQIEILEAISVLIKNSLADPCDSLLRALIETYFYLEYILQQDTERRSLSFIVWNTHGINQLIRKTDGVSQQAKQARAIYNKDKFLRGSEFVLDRTDVLASNDRLLSMDEFKEVNEEYLRLKSQKKGSPNWYSMFDGPEDLVELAGKVDLAGVYEGFYRSLSNAVHGTDVVRGKFSRDKEGHFLINQIRLPTQAQSVTLTCFNIAMMSFKVYLEKRVPEKKSEYLKWFLTIEAFHKRLLGKKMINVS
jgi:hypothetical protein